MTGGGLSVNAPDRCGGKELRRAATANYTAAVVPGDTLTLRLFTSAVPMCRARGNDGSAPANAARQPRTGQHGYG